MENLRDNGRIARKREEEEKLLLKNLFLRFLYPYVRTSFLTRIEFVIEEEIESQRDASLEKHVRRGARGGGVVGVKIRYGSYATNREATESTEKRAELTRELVYVKSSTVIDSLPASTLL